MTEPLDPPQRSAPDIVHSAAKAAAASLPVVGGAAAELFDLVIPSAFEKRRAAWERLVTEAIDELRDRGLSVDALATDERFATVLIEASKTALGTHLEEKLQLLKNAIVHTALPDGPADFLTIRFLRWIDELSPEHFIMLTYARDPAGWFEAKGIEKPNLYMGGPASIMKEARVPVEGITREVVLRDLSDRALANTGGPNVTMTGEGASQPWATDLGVQLADFVATF